MYRESSATEIQNAMSSTTMRSESSEETNTHDSDLDAAVFAVMLRRLIEADLNPDADPELTEQAFEDLLSSASAASSASAGDRLRSVLRTCGLINQVLVELACRPSLGRARSEVISTLSHAARAASVKRRRSPGADLVGLVQAYGSEVCRFADIEVDLGRGSVRRSGRGIQLTAAELRMLLCLLHTRDQVVVDQVLFEAAWPGQPLRAESVTTVINSLRRKLGDDSRTQNVIRTVWGRGYQLAAAVQLERRTRPQ